MKEYLGQDFLLDCDAARELYHTYAQDAPIVDFHNHLPVRDLASDRRYGDIGELWVCSDPYKHRAMRLLGYDERLISGNASSKEKFLAWCKALPVLIGNPLYHWSGLEMLRYFGLNLPCDPETVWSVCNEKLASSGYSALSLLKRVGVKICSTSDDLLDDVSFHKQASLKSGISITPSLRADSIVALDDGWLERLGGGGTIDAFMDAVKSRLDVFSEAGCVISDHALDNGWRFEAASPDEAARLFACRHELDACGAMKLKSFILAFLAGEYARRGWVMQLHIGAERHTSTVLRKQAGPAGGYATMGNQCDLDSLCRLFDSLDIDGLLPKTILYTLNPSDNVKLANLTGSYSESGVQKLKFGPAWWYNDHKYGIEENLEVLSAHSLLSTAVGMTTDSRSLLSFSRHEYFRRILCSFIGGKVERGELPSDMELLGGIVRAVSFGNAQNWIYGK